MRSGFLLLAAAALLALAGCQGAFNPFNRPGNWSETGASNEALAQQVANKSDLISGHSQPGSDGIIAVGGIEKATAGGTASGIQTTITPTTVSTGGS